MPCQPTLLLWRSNSSAASGTFYSQSPEKGLGGENAFLENAKVGNSMRSQDVQDVVTSPVVALPQLRTAAQSELPAPSRRKERSLTWETVQTAVLL